jgi:dynein heavy chain
VAGHALLTGPACTAAPHQNPWSIEAHWVNLNTCRKLFKLTKVFAGGANAEARELPLAVAEEGQAKVVAFQAYLPLISAVCNPGLRERHWEALAELVGFTIKHDEVSLLSL